MAGKYPPSLPLQRGQAPVAIPARLLLKAGLPLPVVRTKASVVVLLAHQQLPLALSFFSLVWLTFCLVNYILWYIFSDSFNRRGWYLFYFFYPVFQDGLDDRIFVEEYKTKLPSEAEIKKKIEEIV
jgi:hypothetical protein